MGFVTEEQLPGIPWMYGLPALFEVGFFTPVQTIFLVKTATVPTEQGHPFRARPQRCPTGIRLSERRLTMKILMVLTSHNVLGNTGKPTGFWLEEFTAPYYAFTDAGAEVAVASVKGGQPPIDPKSDELGNQTDSMERFKKDPAVQKVLANTAKLSEVTGTFMLDRGAHPNVLDEHASARCVTPYRTMAPRSVRGYPSFVSRLFGFCRQ